MVAGLDPVLIRLQTVLAGRYHVVGEIGRGGMGIVYQATDLSLDRPVAIKVLTPALAIRPDHRERFLTEARTAAGLSHPNIVPVHAVEAHDDLVCIMMGFVEGETLGDRVRRLGPLPADVVMRVMQEVAWALSYAHRQRVIHRDIKPDNILLEEGTGRALVTDFGIATGFRGESDALEPPMGTPAYMAPEQRQGIAVDGRADLYALGGVAYFALTGRPPHDSEGGLIPVAGAGLGVLRPGLPTRLVETVGRCLAPIPGERFELAEQVAEAARAARGRVLPVPPAIRVFLEASRLFTVEVASYGAVAVVLALEALIARGSQYAHDGLIFVLLYAIPVLAGVGMVRGTDLIRRARALLKEGHTLGEVMRFADAEAGAEEKPRRPATWWLPRVVGGLGLAALWGGAVWMWSRSPVLGGTLAILRDSLLWAGLTIGPVALTRVALGKMIQPGRRTGLWSRLMWKALDWKVFKVAGIGLGRKTPIALPEATVFDHAAQLYDQIPEAHRRELGGVPDLLGRLEESASALARREAELGRAIGDIGPIRSGAPGTEERQTLLADLSAARQAVAGRLQTTMAAIETLRLVLLRLRHGVAQPSEVTGEITRVLDLADRIDRLIEAEQEVLDTPASPTPA